MIKQLLKAAFVIGVLVAPFAHAGNSLIQGKTSAGIVRDIQVNDSGQVVTTPDSSLNQTIDATNVYEGCTPTNATATGAVRTTGGALCGIMVSASSLCTIQLHDNASAASGTVFLGTTSAITAPAFFPVKGIFTNGLYFTEGGTCDVTFYANTP